MIANPTTQLPARWFLRLAIIVVLSLATRSVLAYGPLTILLTNDDGYKAPGIVAVQKALVDAGHDVYLIAPGTGQSGSSSGMTSAPLAVTQHGERTWAVAGKPADAVRFGLGVILRDSPPDLVVSGANFGQNAGADVMVSGTVGAALTAMQLGIPALAVSVEIDVAEARTGFPSTMSAFDDCAEFVADLIGEMRELPYDSILNVNYPARPRDLVKGVRLATASNYSIISNNFEQDDNGHWVAGLNPAPPEGAKDADVVLLDDGYITLLRLDRDISARPESGDKRLVKKLNR